MISVEGLTVEFGGFSLFDDVSFVVNKKDRIALVGKNGAGKSTMLKIFAGLQSPTSGNVSIPKELTIGYLPQQMQLTDTRTVRQEAEQAFDQIHQLEKQLEKLTLELAERTDYETESYHNLIDKVTHLTEHFQMMGGNSYQAELERTLIGLGFVRDDFERLTSEFSGGWRMRIELAKLLLRQPDVLLLDEPTNHLDIESIQWLENFLATRANAVILVSHDRAFIDATTFRTIEISLGKIYDYKVNYSQYVTLREERREQQLRAFENQQKKLQDTEAFIERFRYKATKSVQVQSRIKQLEKIDRLEVDEVDTAMLNLKFPPAPRSGSYPVIMEEVAKRYGDHLIFEHATLTINRGDKVAFVGKNGEGKSTLVKCIMGEIDFEGKLQLGHNVKIGYFAQNQAQMLDDKLTVFDTIDYVAQGDIRTKIRDILGAFMFGGEASDKKVGVLSGGERSRLAMIRLLLEPVNLLILDEPTNHLDMRSKDVLKDALKEFDGTVILVSHDREFLDGLVDKVYEFGNQRITEHLGGIYEFLNRKKMDNLQELERATQLNIAKNALGDEQPSQNKLSYESRKEQNRALKKAEKAVAEAEERIARLENEQTQIEARLATPEGSSDTTLYAQYASIKKELSETMDLWSCCIQELEDLQQ
ncbi:MAG: ABC-F family ATP-binding cassette domain-containing protein [Parabacteroides sp.]|jgi:ATP-binding cassette subfamily F protein 3|nr:ABC-F family ATP-binding cassette domain-containing protein [Parabacteroides sp.]MCE5226600.1 ABC-F family ATP-binding cassette domain-containing protein [Porphyromonadaceae bacterium]MBP8759622.1 ABC-F family ATP-binding cassette domain-containing protein [Parabacteroides sp.]MBP9480899.1 ABC-F family ATP-binding cassette domain-containing protein [Parabacteroides sp.]MDD2415563.1 ABC-F family ATP-binding cassette domain-containing protein [Parabacteroides sp.]